MEFVLRSPHFSLTRSPSLLSLSLPPSLSSLPHVPSTQADCNKQPAPSGLSPDFRVYVAFGELVREREKSKIRDLLASLMQFLSLSLVARTHLPVYSLSVCSVLCRCVFQGFRTLCIDCICKCTVYGSSGPSAESTSHHIF